MISRKQSRQTSTRVFATPGRCMGFARNLFAAGLVFALIGLLAIVFATADRAPWTNFRSSMRTEISSVPLLPYPPFIKPRLGQCKRSLPQQRIPCTVAADSSPRTGAVALPITVRAMSDARSGHDRSREFLQDAAAMRNPGVRTQGMETRTDLWINAPGMVGNSSPPEASPAHSSAAR